MGLLERMSPIALRASGGFDYACCGCGYGAATSLPPLVCPLCGGRDWVDRRPAPRCQLIVSSVGEHSCIIALPSRIDDGAQIALSRMVVELAQVCDQIFLDLCGTEAIEGETGRLLVHLSSLVSRAGARLVAVCTASDGMALSLVDVGTGDEGGGSS